MVSINNAVEPRLRSRMLPYILESSGFSEPAIWGPRVCFLEKDK